MRKVFLGIVTALTMAGASASAQAALVNEGNGLIYDTVTNVTWSQDANLFQTMFASNSNLVNDIIAADPVIYDIPNAYDNPTDSGTYHVSQVDFYAEYGAMTWYGSQAFVGYLNHIAYKGYKTWALPSPDTSCSLYTTCTTGQYGELFWDEMNGVVGLGGMPAQSPNYGPFVNVALSGNYWTGEQYQPNPSYAWAFTPVNGDETAFHQDAFGLAWAMLPGNVAAVPEPADYEMLLVGLGLVGFAVRLRNFAVRCVGRC